MQLSLITVLLSFILSVNSHCMLDMRLDLENNLDAVGFSRELVIPNIKRYKQLINDNKYNSKVFSLFRSQTKNFFVQDYMTKSAEKINNVLETSYNMLGSHCRPIGQAFPLNVKLDKQGEYDIFYFRADLEDDQIKYSGKGKYNIMIKKIHPQQFPGLTWEMSKHITVSRVATLVRARECLLNVQAYNMLDNSFERMKSSIERRTEALNELMQKTHTTDYNLDAVPALDCMYHTPVRPNSKDTPQAITENTVFYITYPYLQSNLNNLFFKKPELLTAYFKQYNWYTNDLEFRLNIIEYLLRGLKSLHNTGIIHKNIRLGNIYFHYNNDADSENKSKTFVSFGDFSLAGIDDYDARVTKTFFVPNDSKTELGPKFDIYQLGIVITQILYMIPNDKSQDMSLALIAMLADSSFKISHRNNQVTFFSSVMQDAIEWRQSGDIDLRSQQYGDYMSAKCAKCVILIFEQFALYFQRQVWDIYDEAYFHLKQAMYFFRPKNDEESDIPALIHSPYFANIFKSAFFNIYGLIPECYGKLPMPRNMRELLQTLIHPSVIRRTNLFDALKKLYEVQDYIQFENEEFNVSYEEFDKKVLTRSNSKILYKKETMKLI